MILAALALALQTAPPPAAIPLHEVSIGYGTCEDWTRARYYSSGARRTDERARRMEQWAWGYLTAFERYGRPRRTVQAEVRNGFWGELDAYCAAHQQMLFGEAVGMLVERSRRRPSRKR